MSELFTKRFIKAKYRGFSTRMFYARRDLLSSELDLIKEDILNHIYTRKGERVNMPNYGTRIPDLAFEPLDEVTLNIIQEDLREVIKRDGRCDIVDLLVLTQADQNLVVARLILTEKKTGKKFEINPRIQLGTS